MDRDWVETAGTVVLGYGVASGTGSSNPYPGGSLAAQMPLFAQRGLDLRRCHRGTINVDIAPARFIAVEPAYTFRDVAWTEHIPPETFSFFHCRLIGGDESVAGWVYLPHPETKVEHFHDDSLVEVITTFVPSLREGSAVRLLLPRSEARLVKS